MSDPDKFVEAMTRADEAMQDALKYMPERKLTEEIVNRNFREIRATLVMAHELKREGEAE